jgi:hypothetical protein
LPGLPIEEEDQLDGDSENPDPISSGARMEEVEPDADKPEDPATQTDPPIAAGRQSRNIICDCRILSNPRAKPTRRALSPPIDPDPNPPNAIATAYISAILSSQPDRERQRSKEPERGEMISDRDELQTLNDMKTWEMVALPKDCIPIVNRWTFVTK